MEVFPRVTKSVTAGWYHRGLILRCDGSLWSSGSNMEGQFGDGTTVSKNPFVQVMSENVETVAAGGQHTLVLDCFGGMWGAVSNSCDQLGDDTSDDRKNFVQVIFRDAATLTAGTDYSLVVIKTALCTARVRTIKSNQVTNSHATGKGSNRLCFLCSRRQ